MPYNYLFFCVYLFQVVPAISDQEALGTQLLHVAGQKMKTVLMNSNLDLKEKMANLSPSLTLWIRQLVRYFFTIFFKFIYFNLLSVGVIVFVKWES